jgi:hypothetical protein
MKQNKTNLFLAAVLILAAALAKVLTHPNSVDPIIGMALFGGAVINDKKFAFMLPLFAMLLSDIMIELVFGAGKGFYGMGQLVNYGILALITVFGFSLKKINAKNVIGFSLVSSGIFYVISNLGFFLIDNNKYHLYTNDFKGFINCYIAALPFAKVHIDLLFSVLLFGSYYLINTYAINNKKATA